MSSTPIFPSAESEKRWVLAMEKNFLPHHILDIPFCVFRVSKKLSEAKPEAYASHQLGLGPLHHLRPDLYAMTNQKIAAITEFLPPEKLNNFRLVVDALVQLEPAVRACYDQFLDLDIETLAWILAVDAVYLLHFLKNYPELKQLAGDVLMLENQIPFVALDKIVQVLELSAADDDYRSFFDDQSPLELNSAVTESTNYYHLLHQMYSLIVSNRGFKVKPQTRIGRIQLDDVVESVQFLADRGLPGAGTAAQILTFIKTIPWGKIFKKDGQDSSTSADEIEIPSVSQTTEIAGITFLRTPGGIRDLRFDDEKQFYLPLIKISATTEVVVRNLVAYETASAAAGATLELAEYVDLMCGIIDSRKDVEILRNAGIVTSELDDEEIVRIFNGISKSEKKTDEKSGAEEAVEGVNAKYGSIGRVKVKKMAEKYGYGCLKIMSDLHYCGGAAYVTSILFGVWLREVVWQHHDSNSPSFAFVSADSDVRIS